MIVNNILIIILTSVVTSILVSLAMSLYFKNGYKATFKELEEEIERQKFIVTETITNIISQNDQIKESLEVIKGYIKENIKNN